MNKHLERMFLSFGEVYQFPGASFPCHYNDAGLSKSIDFETGVILKNFIEWEKPQTIVELGTFRGYSTSWLILGALLNGSGHVHAFEVFPEGHYGPMWYDTFGLPKENFTYHEIPHGIWNYTDEIPAKIDFIFHDTQHLPGPTQTEMELLMPRVSVGGVILFDDMLHLDYVPMQRYLINLFNNKAQEGSWTWVVVPVGHGIGIARKVRGV